MTQLETLTRKQPAGGSATGPNCAVERLGRACTALERQVFFIVGCQKSGTTWVQHLLDGHPAARCHGEGYFAAVLMPLLQQVAGAFNQRHKAGELGGLGDEDVRALFAAACGLHFDRWIGDAAGIEAVGEKTPEHALCLPAIDATFPDAKVVHVIRDGRDVCVSGWFHNLRLNNPQFRQRFPDFASYVAYTTGNHWVPYIQRARQFGHAHPDRYHEVRYEQLHAASAETVGALLGFLGLDDGAASVEACLEAGAFDRLSGGRKQGEADAASFYRKGVVGDWRAQFDDAALAAFRQHGGALADELGYGD